MIISPIGALFLLLGIAVALLNIRKLYGLIFIASVFNGTFGVAFNYGSGISILPSPMLTSVFILAIYSLHLFNIHRLRVKEIVKLRNYLFGLGLAGVVSLLIALILFAGTVHRIIPGGVSEEIYDAVPLFFTNSNVAQTIYWILSASLVYAAAISGYYNKITSAQLIRLCIITCVFVCSVGIYEVTSSLLNLPFPHGMLINAAFIDIPPDRFNMAGFFGISISRMSATFGEPSHLSIFLLGILALLLTDSNRKTKFISIYIILCLILTFSSTAFIGMMIILFLTLLKLKPIRVIISLAILISILIPFAIYSDARIIDAWLQTVIFKLGDFGGYELGNHSSAAERMYWDYTAIRAFIDTFGVGVGFGSTRASSFLLTTVASSGVIGVFLCYKIYILFKTNYKLALDVKSKDTANIKGLSYCVALWLVGASISNPDFINSHYCWVVLGGVLGQVLRHASASINHISSMGASKNLEVLRCRRYNDNLLGTR